MNELLIRPRDGHVTELTPAIPVQFAHTGLSLSQLLAMLRARWRMSAVIMLTVAALTVTALKLWPRTYTAVASVMVNYEVEDPLNGASLPTGQVGSYIATQVELMQNPEVLQDVVDQLDLTHDSHYTNGYRGVGTLGQWAAAMVGRNLDIFQGQRGSQLIYVNYSANDPDEAARVANAVIDVYRQHDHTRSTEEPGERARLYAQEIEELKAKVDEAQRNLTGFRQANGLLNEGDDAGVDLALLTTAEAGLFEARNQLRAAEAKAGGNQAVSDQVLGSSEVQELKARLNEQQLRLTQLNQLYTPDYSEVRDQKVLIESTRRALADAVNRYSDNATEELSSARRQEQSLQRTVASQRAKVLNSSRLHAQESKYLLDLNSAQTVYKRALEGFDQITFAAQGHYSNVTTVSQATPPVKPSAPRMRLGLMLGCMAAGVLGLGIPLVLELVNRRIRSRDDLELHSGIPVLMEFRRPVAGLLE
jgi:uncharacterized protein involved in exopolysaccharide biosynthesis